jgi:hypothetical protein
MPVTRAMLISLKRCLLSARILMQEAATSARRAGDADRAERLRGIAERLADELDDLNALLAKHT